jgi:hypothetical protein
LQDSTVRGRLGRSTRQCGYLSHPEDDGSESDDGAVISSGLFEAGGDAAELLKFGDAAFNEMALGMEMFVNGYLRARDGSLGITASALLAAMSWRK